MMNPLNEPPLGRQPPEAAPHVTASVVVRPFLTHEVDAVTTLLRVPLAPAVAVREAAFDDSVCSADGQTTAGRGPWEVTLADVRTKHVRERFLLSHSFWEIPQSQYSGGPPTAQGAAAKRVAGSAARKFSSGSDVAVVCIGGKGSGKSHQLFGSQRELLPGSIVGRFVSTLDGAVRIGVAEVLPDGRTADLLRCDSGGHAEAVSLHDCLVGPLPAASCGEVVTAGLEAHHALQQLGPRGTTVVLVATEGNGPVAAFAEVEPLSGGAEKSEVVGALRRRVMEGAPIEEAVGWGLSTPGNDTQDGATWGLALLAEVHGLAAWQTHVLACISPSPTAVHATHATLSFAASSTSITAADDTLEDPSVRSPPRAQRAQRPPLPRDCVPRGRPRPDGDGDIEDIVRSLRKDMDALRSELKEEHVSGRREKELLQSSLMDASRSSDQAQERHERQHQMWVCKNKQLQREYHELSEALVAKEVESSELQSERVAFASALRQKETELAALQRRLFKQERLTRAAESQRQALQTEMEQLVRHTEYGYHPECHRSSDSPVATRGGRSRSSGAGAKPQRQRRASQQCFGRTSTGVRREKARADPAATAPQPRPKQRHPAPYSRCDSGVKGQAPRRVTALQRTPTSPGVTRSAATRAHEPAEAEARRASPPHTRPGRLRRSGTPPAARCATPPAGRTAGRSPGAVRRSGGASHRQRSPPTTARQFARQSSVSPSPAQQDEPARQRPRQRLVSSSVGCRSDATSSVYGRSLGYTDAATSTDPNPVSCRESEDSPSAHVRPSPSCSPVPRVGYEAHRSAYALRRRPALSPASPSPG
eukprot:TRINITY_DN4918_c0_g1_i2.p1 TRINITY_DN4918_c0_g1~~TRINITY_DN4918_c0_g1_i2.p1  ORF type:complete len:821 (+),score=280.05 TRINITY_DN4918_c0_g1_i2:47-2509(+)